MQLTSKKYFSISEVAEITGVPQHKLRYLEKSSAKVEIFQIRGRRYYTAADIASIKQKFGVADKIVTSLLSQKPPSPDIISQIDSLIAKFTQLI